MDVSRNENNQFGLFGSSKVSQIEGVPFGLESDRIGSAQTSLAIPKIGQLPCKKTVVFAADPEHTGGDTVGETNWRLVPVPIVALAGRTTIESRRNLAKSVSHCRVESELCTGLL